MFFANAVVKAAQILMEEEEEEEDVSSESVITRRIQINRDRQGAHEKLVNDYFSDVPLYNANIFRRRFRMSRWLYKRIADDLAGLDPFFTQRPDARNYEGFNTLKKCIAAIRQLAYGTVADALDEYLQMSARTTRECLYRFCHNVVKLYRKQYLRKPNAYNVQQLYQTHEARHKFPGMLGSIDCMHWAWHNCPNAWLGQYTRGDHGHPTLILEAVASQDLWIWHSFFGLPGSLNDLNVLYQSAIFSDVVNGTGPDTRFTVSGVEYRHEGRAICEYDENASYGNTFPVDLTQQDLNSCTLTNDYMHANLQQDLVEHIWNNANDGDGDEDEDEDEDK
ncbi:uncharacterized protein LOC110943278 [Helianthus annuus]|uniref:uncharacterized protein LOC110943278 n=1 Tax=Helianthus annuus TaxID=4232 RepID=UPI000B8F7FFE|nr:uncharacterized protein LOC110943278 [Helianthus annuus]